MCGLIGAFRADNAHIPKFDHFMWQGLYLSALRGMGGTGVGVVHKDYEMDFAKSHVSAPNFLYSEEWDWVDKSLIGARAALGHTRSATQGTIKTKNSHPFMLQEDETGVLMIHNGHIKNWSILSPNTYHHDVDSAHVCHSLFTRGAIPTLQMLEGAYTLVWYDKKNKTMNLARNEERELYCTTNKDNSCFWFASELDMLSAVLKRNGIPHSRDFFELPKLTLCQYDLTKPVLTAVHTEYEEKKSLPVSQSASGGHYVGQSGGIKDYTKNFAGPGDFIFCNVRAEDDKALKLYQTIGDGEDQVSEENAFGFVYGTRTMDFNSVVRVNGLSYKDWEDRLKYIKACLPVKISRVERGLKKQDGTGLYTYFECVLDVDGTADECRRMSSSITMRKKREEWDRNKASTDSGRALPVPQTNESATDELGCGTGEETSGEHTVLGPNDRGGPGRPIPDVGMSTPRVCIPAVEGPRGTKIPIDLWRSIAEEGCYFCNGVILDIDVNKVEWWQHPQNVEDRRVEDAEYQMICPCCKDNPKKIEALIA